MSQHNLDNYEPTNRSGSDLKALFEALFSGHIGTARPTYAEKGTMWFKEVGDPLTHIEAYMFDGSADGHVWTYTVSSGTVLPSRMATQSQAEGGTNNTTIMSPLRVSQQIAARSEIIVYAEDVLVDDGTYTTGSQSLTTFKRYFVPETQASSRLICDFKCRAGGIDGSNNDAGVEHNIHCVDATSTLQTINGVDLWDTTLTRITNDGSANFADVYGTVFMRPPVLPNSAKIDFATFPGSGLTGNGWVIEVKHAEDFNSTAQSQALRFHFKEINDAA